MSNLSFTSSHASRILNVVRGGLKPAGIDAHVTRSWYRCMKEYGIEPTAKRESVVLDPQTVREAQHRMGELLRVARAEMESLYDQIAGSGFAVILSDTQGAVMSTITDPTLQREFRQAGLWLGALWDEKHEGTNGIGTCLAEGCSVTVHREEHYRGYNVGLVLFRRADPRCARLAARGARCLVGEFQRQPSGAASHDGAGQHEREPDFALEFPQRLQPRLGAAFPQPSRIRRPAARSADRGRRQRQHPRRQRKRDAAARQLAAHRVRRPAGEQLLQVRFRHARTPRQPRTEHDLAGARSRPRPPLLRAGARAAARGDARATRCHRRIATTKRSRRRANWRRPRTSAKIR